MVGHSETIVRWQRGRIGRLFVEVNLTRPVWRDAVTAEVASSSLVVPAIHSKRVASISLKPTRTQKGTFSCPFSCPFWPPLLATADCSRCDVRGMRANARLDSLH